MDATTTPPASGIEAAFPFQHSYAEQLEGLYVPWHGTAWPQPRLVLLNAALAQAMGLELAGLPRDALAALLSGSALPANARPIAQAYAGHQFGGFSPQLGDGRALLVGELVDAAGARRDLHLKGSGRTPFSRGGDGKAVLGPMLREYIVSEAMHALGIPSTRALAVVATGEQVAREGWQPGAVLARIAASHLRVGTFQFFASQGDTEKLRRLADYAIARHDPALAQAEDPYLAFFEAVARRQAALIARWMGVGFVHGVMNTDNMTISGETIDYGPCAFLDGYSARAVFSSIDHGGRYAYANQPGIARWNLARFAEALLPLIAGGDSEQGVPKATAVLEAWGDVYDGFWRAGLRAKLGLRPVAVDASAGPPDADESALFESLFALMEVQGADFTLTFRHLATRLRGDAGPSRTLFAADPVALDAWCARWQHRLDAQGADTTASADAMDRVNPLYIPRNQLVEAALTAASEQQDLAPLQGLLDALADPFNARPGLDAYAEPAAAGCGPYVTYCGT